MREWFARQIDRRDLLGIAGVCLLAYGGEALHPGAGITAAGAVLVLVAVFGVR